MKSCLLISVLWVWLADLAACCQVDQSQHWIDWADMWLLLMGKTYDTRAGHVDQSDYAIRQLSFDWLVNSSKYQAHWSVRYDHWCKDRRAYVACRRGPSVEIPRCHDTSWPSSPWGGRGYRRGRGLCNTHIITIWEFYPRGHSSLYYTVTHCCHAWSKDVNEHVWKLVCRYITPSYSHRPSFPVTLHVTSFIRDTLSHTYTSLVKQAHHVCVSVSREIVRGWLVLHGQPITAESSGLTFRLLFFLSRSPWFQSMKEWLCIRVIVSSSSSLY